ncbi:MAG: hypothetical protein ACLGHT_09105 [Acidimicrobiia bacterium]
MSAALIVTSTSELLERASTLLSTAGWQVRLGFDAPPRPWELSGESLAFVGEVTSSRHTALAIAIAARGAAVAAYPGSESLRAQVVDDLSRIGHVTVWTPTSTPLVACLSDEEIRLLELLAEGHVVSAAARSANMSRRTADRRLALARSKLGVGSNAEALITVGAELSAVRPGVAGA